MRVPAFGCHALFVCAALLATGCGTDIAQTAALGPAGLPDCSTPGAVTLPNDAVFGSGSEPASELVGTGYDAGNGPGLFVLARDAFRVYLNGALVTASTSARVGVFVPLSLLPGDNALSVVVAAKSGTPAAWLQLDELEQSYPSDASWKVTSAPERGYADATFDDSSWANASDLGARGALAGCDTNGAFPTAANAHWIGGQPGSSSPIVLRKVIHIAAIGYGAGTTGGGAAPPQVVTTWLDLQTLATDPSTPATILLPEGSYDFRDVPSEQLVCASSCSNDASKPIYTALTSTETCPTALVPKIKTARTLNLGSNKTIVGLGRGAQLRGVNMQFGTTQNVIVRNVAVYDVNRDLIEAKDAFGLVQPSQIWIDHATTKWISDGFSDVGAGTHGVTLSWLHYDGVTSDECDGEHTRAAQISDAIITLHHCFFDHVESHAPRVDSSAARVHLFNNLIADDSSYAVGSVCGSQVLMEGNAFQRVATPTERSTCADGSALGLIDAPAGSNFYGDDVGPHHGGDGNEPHDAVSKPPYEYTVQSAQDEWLTVLSRAGAGGPWAQPLELN
jgi:pectate lyase